MSSTKRKLIIVSGLSGAGKTTSLGLLEDIGCFCVDNIPPQLLDEILNLFAQTDIKKMALGVDARWKKSLADAVKLFNNYQALKNSIDFEIFFLEASEAVIAKRYALTRRKHPLQESGDVSLAYQKEKRLVAPIREAANHIIDTSYINAHKLREILKKSLEMNNEPNSSVITLRFVSFGFKYGIPMNSDFVIDCRFLPNPYWNVELASLTGKDEKVIEYFKAIPAMKEYIDSIFNMLKIAVEKYEDEGRSSLTICIGCSGGRHRSVYIAEKMYSKFKKLGYSIFPEHRDTNF